MFDANMRYLPKRHEFFAEFRGVDKGHPLKPYSENHSVILCEMLSKGNENPTVRFFLDDRSFEMTDEQCGTGSWIAYSGNKDGTGFICDKKRAEAKHLLAESFGGDL